MTVLIVEPKMLTNAHLERIWDDLLEAMEHEQRTGFITRVALVKFDKNKLPIYKKLPDDELTYIEWRCND